MSWVPTSSRRGPSTRRTSGARSPGCAPTSPATAAIPTGSCSWARRRAPRTSPARLVASRVPVLFAVAEYDPPVSHRQAELLFAALVARDGRVPHLVFLSGHNHFTEVQHLNTEDRLLGDHVLEFV